MAHENPPPKKRFDYVDDRKSAIIKLGEISIYLLTIVVIASVNKSSCIPIGINKKFSLYQIQLLAEGEHVPRSSNILLFY